MNYYPLMLNIEGMPVTVVGGGDVGYRKIKDLLERGAVVTVIAPDICSAIKELTAGNPEQKLTLLERAYRRGDLDGASLVFAATDSTDVNESVFREATARKILINAVDDPPRCTFIVPSILQRGDLTVAVSTGGTSPAMAARIRRYIEGALPDNIDRILELLKKVRSLLMTDEAFSAFGSDERGRLLKRIVQEESLAERMLEAGDGDGLVRILQALMEQGDGNP